MVIFSLGLGLLGVYGFSQIKNSTEDATREIVEKTAKEVAERAAKEVAEKKAEEVAKIIVERFLSREQLLDFGKPSHPYSKKDAGKKKRGESNA